ncbi:MAG: energy transducer TonB family protein [Pseudomonadota bacterium]
MRRGDGLIALLAAALSLLAHALLLFNAGTVAGNSDQAQPQQTTRVSFRSVAAPPSPPEPLPEPPPKPPEPEVVETPEPPPKPEPEPPEPEPVEPEPKAKKALQPEPPKAPPEPAPEPTPPPPAEPSSASTEKAPAPAEKVQGTVAEPGLTEQAKQEYLRRLMAHIEAHKRYPRAARRRGIEGDVAVSFELQGTGDADAITATGAHRVLLTAAREALADAHPLPLPPAEQPLPWTIEFTMRFTLQ